MAFLNDHSFKELSSKKREGISKYLLQINYHIAEFKYRKIPVLSPGLVQFRKGFFF